jgi:flagellar basal-body rod protein FlgB
MVRASHAAKAENRPEKPALFARSIAVRHTYDETCHRWKDTVMLGKLDNHLRFNELALSLRSTRQTVLASNIANADTPNYKARDIDFAAALQGALANTAGGANSGSLNTTAARHFQNPAPGGSTLPDGTPLKYRGVVQGAVDGNTVDMDVERNQFADNALRYEAGVTFINSQIKGLMTAIQGQ